jgi:hypothetical protein
MNLTFGISFDSIVTKIKKKLLLLLTIVTNIKK